jgi:hypothetical protein
MAKFILPEDVDEYDVSIKILQAFIDALNYSVLKESIIMPNGRVMITGDSIYELLSSVVNSQKQLRLDIVYNKAKNILHTHIWDNETPNRLYSHSHTKGDIPHGHHGSKYLKVEKEMINKNE